MFSRLFSSSVQCGKKGVNDYSLHNEQYKVCFLTAENYVLHVDT